MDCAPLFFFFLSFFFSWRIVNAFFFPEKKCAVMTNLLQSHSVSEELIYFMILWEGMCLNS